MRVGLVARCDRSGLGYQTKAIAKLLDPDKILVVDSTPFNQRTQHFDWYEGAQVSNGFPTNEDLDIFLRDLDVVITCETPYNYALFTMAKERGIKTVLQPNPEFFDYFRNPLYPKPDALFAPSMWYINDLERVCKTYFCPPPIDIKPNFVKRKKKSGKLNVLHIAGRTTYEDRNGTEVTKKACQDLEGVNLTVIDQNVTDIENQADIFPKDCHVVLLPRKYGGLCLPMLESISQGLPILMTNVVPNNCFLPANWLIPVTNFGKFQARMEVTYYEVATQDVQSKLIAFREMSDTFYSDQVKVARDLYEEYEGRLENWVKYLEEVVG